SLDILRISSLNIPLSICTLFFFNDPATTEIYTLSLHDALPISGWRTADANSKNAFFKEFGAFLTFSNYPNMPVSRQLLSGQACRSEEHTSELQSRGHLVCRLLLEKKKIKNRSKNITYEIKAAKL